MEKSKIEKLKTSVLKRGRVKSDKDPKVVEDTALVRVVFETTVVLPPLPKDTVLDDDATPEMHAEQVEARDAARKARNESLAGLAANVLAAELAPAPVPMKAAPAPLRKIEVSDGTETRQQ